MFESGGAGCGGFIRRKVDPEVKCGWMGAQGNAVEDDACEFLALGGLGALGGEKRGKSAGANESGGSFGQEDGSSAGRHFKDAGQFFGIRLGEGKEGELHGGRERL